MKTYHETQHQVTTYSNGNQAMVIFGQREFGEAPDSYLDSQILELGMITASDLIEAEGQTYVELDGDLVYLREGTAEAVRALLPTE